jgi:hypothetical protein
VCVCACVCVRSCASLYFVCGVCLGMYATTHTHTHKLLWQLSNAFLSRFISGSPFYLSIHTVATAFTSSSFSVIHSHLTTQNSRRLVMFPVARLLIPSGHLGMHKLIFYVHTTPDDVSDESHGIGQRIEYCVSSLQACGSGNGRHDDQPQSG